MAKMKVVLDQLVAEGHLSPTAPAEAARLLAGEETATPWYIQAAVGISAWIAAVFIIGFITTGIFLTESSTVLAITGLVFCGAAGGVKRLFPRSIFAGQLSLAVSLAGQGLFIAGVGSGSESVVTTALATMALEAALIVLYPGTLHRLISSLAIIGAVLVILFVEWELYETAHAVIILLAGLALIAWYGDTWFMVRRWTGFSRPIGYAAVLALFGLLVPSAIPEVDFVQHWWISTLVLLLIFLTLIFLMVRTGGLTISPVILSAVAGGVVVLSLVTWQAPGVLAALSFMLLGFWRGHRLVLGIAVAFLAFFIGGFYYNLDLTLLEKSWILMGSGLLFLIGRYFLLGQLNPEQEGA